MSPSDISDRWANHSHSHPVLTPKVTKTITYTLLILSTAEAKKIASKCVAETQSMQLSTDEPWDTMKAQILAKISTALNPPLVDFDNYNIMFYIPHVLPKPGLTFTIEYDFTIMNGSVCNMKAQDPTINSWLLRRS